jgi:hypothetical protein
MLEGRRAANEQPYSSATEHIMRCLWDDTRCCSAVHAACIHESSIASGEGWELKRRLSFIACSRLELTVWGFYLPWPGQLIVSCQSFSITFAHVGKSDLELLDTTSTTWEA